MTSRAAQHCLAGRMWPVGPRLESPALRYWPYTWIHYLINVMPLAAHMLNIPVLALPIKLPNEYNGNCGPYVEHYGTCPTH